MAAVRSSLRSLGVSNAAIGFVRDSHRAGTRQVYQAKWANWLRWCEDQRVDPLRPHVVQLANFLARLGEQGLTASTLKGYRSAIQTTLKQLGGRVRRSSDRPALVSDVLKGVAVRDARSPRRLPLWDLFLVLESLREAPFEPLAQAPKSLLTLKTVFLVTLACARRSSEVHGLSGLPADIAFESDGSVSLRFLPDFRAKNQRDSEFSPEISIPSLSAVLARDDADRLLCPVRALRFYLSITKSTRAPGQRRLFLSFNTNYKRDIKVSTISRWLARVVKMAYERAHQNAPSTRAHELRALAASLAFEHSIPLHQVLEAAFWKSDATFIHHYLRDTSRLRQDGSRGIGTMVSSQRVLSNARRQ